MMMGMGAAASYAEDTTTPLLSITREHQPASRREPLVDVVGDIDALKEAILFVCAVASTPLGLELLMQTTKTAAAAGGGGTSSAAPHRPLYTPTVGGGMLGASASGAFRAAATPTSTGATAPTYPTVGNNPSVGNTAGSANTSTTLTTTTTTTASGGGGAWEVVTERLLFDIIALACYCSTLSVRYVSLMGLNLIARTLEGEHLLQAAHFWVARHAGRGYMSEAPHVAYEVGGVYKENTLMAFTSRKPMKNGLEHYVLTGCTMDMGEEKHAGGGGGGGGGGVHGARNGGRGNRRSITPSEAYRVVHPRGAARHTSARASEGHRGSSTQLNDHLVGGKKFGGMRHSTGEEGGSGEGYASLPALHRYILSHTRIEAEELEKMYHILRPDNREADKSNLLQLLVAKPHHLLNPAVQKFLLVLCLRYPMRASDRSFLVSVLDRAPQYCKAMQRHARASSRYGLGSSSTNR